MAVAIPMVSNVIPEIKNYLKISIQYDNGAEEIVSLEEGDIYTITYTKESKEVTLIGKVISIYNNNTGSLIYNANSGIEILVDHSEKFSYATTKIVAESIRKVVKYVPTTGDENTPPSMEEVPTI